MKRFHRQVSKSFDESRLKEFTEELNFVNSWNLSSHAIERLQHKFPGIGNSIEKAIKGIKALDYRKAFEYYSDESGICKAVYRYKWKNLTDLILVIGKDRYLVTVYVNSRNDNHNRIDKSLYKR